MPEGNILCRTGVCLEMQPAERMTDRVHMEVLRFDQRVSSMIPHTNVHLKVPFGSLGRPASTTLVGETQALTVYEGVDIAVV